MKSLFFGLLATLLLFSCTDEDLSTIGSDTSFIPVESIQPFEDVKPAYDFDYWELVWKSNSGEEDIHFKKGEKCLETTNHQDCVRDFYSKSSQGPGFGESNEQGYYFIRTNQEGYNQPWESIEDLGEFLGQVDSYGDALLTVLANGFFFEKEDRSQGSIKKTDGRYQVVAMKVVSRCSPYQVDRFLLDIDKSGDVTVIQEEVFLKEVRKCVE